DEELTLSSSDYRTVSGNLDLQISWAPSALKGNTPITFTMTPLNGSGAIGEQVLFNGMIKPRYEYMINSIKLSTSYTDSQGQNYQPEFDGSKSGSGAKYSGKNKFEYTFVTSGTYTINFYVMDYGTRPLRTKNVAKTITINDPDCPTIEQLAADIMADAPDTGSEYDIVLYAHDYILNHGQYDYNSGFTEDNEKIYIDNNYNTAFGSAGIWMGPSAILCRGLGICESYQRALELLLAQKGIQCERVEGRTYSNHVWSRIKIDGEWTLVDLTWDDDSATTSRYNQHLYFGITDDMMLKVHSDHKASATKPCTTFTNNYFLKSGDITAFSDSIKTKIQAELAKGSTDFTVPADYNMYPNFYYIVYPLVAYYLTNTDGDMIAEGVEVSYTFNDTPSDKWNAQ
ncbi:MAG: hypothetical protein HUJ75_01720, partial [Parasporobacterium sp.]|nr:hypothetical protein [Parasporobacterium sp.]